MPELPEVTTTVNGLNKTIKNLVISDIWTDITKNKVIKQFQKTIKDKKIFENFKKNIIGQKILKSERRGKNIFIYLSNEKIILIHLKMTGHLLYGKYIYKKKENKWQPDNNEKSSLKDPFNRFIHVIFSFTNGKHLAFSDARKFGKITLLKRKDIKKISEEEIGPEPLEKDFTFQKFKKRILLFPNKNIKTILMDQSVIAGIGNIYSDEILWMAQIQPESKIKNIPDNYLKNIFISIKKILPESIKLGGDSMSDYRNIYGEKGKFQNNHNVYQRNKKLCHRKNCKGKIERKKIGSRNSYFCNKCQKLFK